MPLTSPFALAVVSINAATLAANSVLRSSRRLLIIDHREDIEELGGEVLLSKVDGKTLKKGLVIKVPKDVNAMRSTQIDSNIGAVCSVK